jgi:sigma-E factor negative regulatory protein RseA
MAEKIHEQVSALMDDECASEEIKLALRRLERDEALQERWQRYHLISDVIKGSVPLAIDADFSARMRSVLDNEPPLTAVRGNTAPAWRKPAIGFALAASVAAVTVLTQRNEIDVNPIPPISGVGDGVQITDGTAATDPGENRLNAYLVNHNSFASMSSVYGVMPYVRMASYQNGR